MDKRIGFALLGFLCIVLAAGWSRSMAGGGGTGGGATLTAAAIGAGGGGGEGGGGGDICSQMIARMMQCKDTLLSQVPPAVRDRAAEEFDRQFVGKEAECRAGLADAKPEDVAKVQQALAAPGCDSFMRGF